MTYSNGKAPSPDTSITQNNVAVIDTISPTEVTFVWSQTASYSAATTENGHTWYGIFSPIAPPRTKIYPQ